MRLLLASPNLSLHELVAWRTGWRKGQHQTHVAGTVLSKEWLQGEGVTSLERADPGVRQKFRTFQLLFLICQRPRLPPQTRTSLARDCCPALFLISLILGTLLSGSSSLRAMKRTQAISTAEHVFQLGWLGALLWIVHRCVFSRSCLDHPQPESSERCQPGDTGDQAPLGGWGTENVPERTGLFRWNDKPFWKHLGSASGQQPSSRLSEEVCWSTSKCSVIHKSQRSGLQGSWNDVEHGCWWGTPYVLGGLNGIILSTYILKNTPAPPPLK